MSLTEDDLQEIINALEEAEKQKALKKQLKALKIDSNQEEKSSESVWKGEDSQIKMNREDKDDHDSNSINQNSFEHPNVRIKREKIRQDLRRNDLEQKFKTKRIIKPLLSECKEEANESGEELEEQYEKQLEEDFNQMYNPQDEEQSEEVEKHKEEERKPKETQKKRKTRSKR